MSATIVHTRFGDLRALSERVSSFYAHEACVDKNELNSHFELDVDGDDAEELLLKFRDQFQVNFDAFRFEEYFYNEGEWSVLAGAIALIIAVVLLLPLRLLGSVVGIVSKSAADTLKESVQTTGDLLFRFWSGRQIQHHLTLGDLIVSAATGSFTTRSQTRLLCRV